MLRDLRLAREALQEAILFQPWPPGRLERAAQHAFLTDLSRSSSYPGVLVLWLSWFPHAAFIICFTLCLSGHRWRVTSSWTPPDTALSPTCRLARPHTKHE